MLPSPGHAMKDRRDHDRLVESDWIMNGAKIRALPQPGGAHAREAFAQAIITGDPNLLLGGFTDLNINVGHEQALRRVLLPYTHLPSDRFEPVLDTGLDTNLAIRRLARGEESWFYVANPCQWPVEGRLTLRTDGVITKVVDGKLATTVRKDGRLELPVRLEPFGLAAYRVASGRLAITGYTTEPLAVEALERLQRIPNRVTECLADLAARLSLAPDDRRFMHETLARVRDAVAGQRYAKAWSLLTHHRFWSLWQGFLEKAAAAPSQAATVEKAAPPARRITYDPTRNCIRVVGFPESQPATLAAIRAADREGRWGKVTYDEASDTYTVDAAIWIGDDRGLGTFVQLGGPQHPRVTAVVRGTVWIRPPRPSDERSDGLPRIINRLRLGDPDDNRIRATLKIHCDTPGRHGVYVGYRSHDSKTILRRGSLHVYHSTITAVVQHAAHRWGVRDYTDETASPRWSMPGWYASVVRLVGATISWFEGCVTYGTSTGWLDRGAMPEDMKPNTPTVFRDTTFEHGEEAVRNGEQYLEHCTFRHMKTAVAEGGALGAKLVGCTLADNRANWTLGSIQSRGIVLRDSTVEAPANPVVIRKNRIAPDVAARQHLPVYPRCRRRRTLVVKVVDAAGHPVPEAVLIVTCAEAPKEVTRGATVTGAGGLTPSDPEADAIVVTEQAWQATDDPETPETSTFGYRVVVRKNGFDPAEAALAPGRPVPRPLTITVQRSARQR